MANMAGDLVPFNHSAEDIKQESIRRSHKAGLTTKDGEPIPSSRSRLSWDYVRTSVVSCPDRTYRKNYKRIFGHD